MLYIANLKVYIENKYGDLERKYYKIQNAKDVLELDLCSGDKLLIDGIGNLEILGLRYESIETGSNPHKSLMITCGLLTNGVEI